MLPKLFSLTARPVITKLTLAVLTAFTFTTLQAADTKPSLEEQIAKSRSELKADDAAVRQTAIGALVHSTFSAKLFPEIQQALSDSDGMVRSTAATAIGNLGADAVPAVPKLIAQLKSDQTKEARETAARALGRIGKAAPASVPQVLPPLRTAGNEDADPVTRVVAMGAIALMDVDVPKEITALRTYLHHDEMLVRMKASHALGMLGIVAREAAPEIVEVLKHETDGHRRGYVARALGNTGDPASLPVLEAAVAVETDHAAQGEMRGAINKLKAPPAAPTKPNP